MNDNEYELIPDTQIWVRDITESFAGKFAETLERNASFLNFPRLRFPLSKGYSTGDYLDIARRLRSFELDVYETRDDQHFNAKYISVGTYNFFVVTPNVTIAPLLSEETLIHEATHAIQDLKQWRMSRLDMEVDAHFSGALYTARKNIVSQSEDDYATKEFIDAAKAFNANKNFPWTLDFHQLRGTMKKNIVTHYWNMKTIFEDNPQTFEAFSKDFKKRRRLDG